MATDVLDEHRFTSQCSLYEPANRRLSKDVKRYPTAASSRTLFETPSTPATIHTQRIKYSTSTTTPTNNTNTNSLQSRHSASNDLLSLIRSVAMKPFKTSSVVNGGAEGQTNSVIGGNHIHDKPPVSLLKYRPLSDNVSDHTMYTQTSRVCI